MNVAKSRHFSGSGNKSCDSDRGTGIIMKKSEETTCEQRLKNILSIVRHMPVKTATKCTLLTDSSGESIDVLDVMEHNVSSTIDTNE